VDYFKQAEGTFSAGAIESSLLSQGMKEADIGIGASILNRTGARLQGLNPQDLVIDAETESFSADMEDIYSKWEPTKEGTNEKTMSAMQTQVDAGLAALEEAMMTPAMSQFYKALLDGLNEALGTGDKRVVSSYVDLTKGLFPKAMPKLRTSAGGN
jgi:hypothetical protein